MFLLIIILQGQSTLMQGFEFNTLEKCQQVEEAVSKVAKDNMYNIATVCVKK